MSQSRRIFLGAAAGLAALSHVGAQAQSSNRARDQGQALAVRTPDGLSLSARSYGDPNHPEILLVHGLGQSRLSWELQINSALIRRFRVVTYDLRGHGDSDKPDAVSAYSDGALLASDLNAVIESAALRSPVLVGWSLGGFAIGQYLARYGHGKVAGVNLVNAVTKLAPELLSQLAKDFSGLLASPDIGIRTDAIESFLAACFAKRPANEAFRRMLVFNGMVPRAVHQGIVQMRSDGLDQAFAATRRLLVTFGAKDQLTLPEMSYRLKALNPAAQMAIYAQMGHTPFYEDARRFNLELASFAAAGV